MSTIKTVCCLCVLISLIGLESALAQIAYEVSFPNRHHQEAEIALTIAGLPDAPLELRMSRTSPGRYSLHEFAKNVYNVRAVNRQGEELMIHRPDPHQWDVLDHEGWVRITYTLFADRADGTYSQIDPSHAHLNMPATFMFARNHPDWPISIDFEIPEGSDWKIATQLFPTDSPHAFTAPGLHYFMDSPTELSNFDLRTWEIPRGPGQEGTYSIHLAVHHLGSEDEVDSYADMVKKVVNQQVAVFGEPPVFDTGNYTFIACYLPWASGDGMEHRNSTILTSSSSLASNSLGLLGTVSHEFFHAWNVERIRPASLEPFNYEAANMSPDLWFAEGFTSYYTPLTIRRAGLMNDEEYASAISGGLNTVMNGAGRSYFSPVGMSLRAPFVDRASFYDPLNLPNTFISYYTWGAAVGLGLDLTLRAKGLSLDGFMRHLWKTYGKDETPVAMNGLQDALASYSGDETMARTFFDNYIRGSDLPPYAELLKQAGFSLVAVNPEKPYAGPARFEKVDEGLRLVSETIVGTPWYEAGLSRGDLVLQFNGKDGLDGDQLLQEIAALAVGSEVPMTFMQRGKEVTARLKLVADPRVEVIVDENALTQELISFRRDWLGE